MPLEKKEDLKGEYKIKNDCYGFRKGEKVKSPDGTVGKTGMLFVSKAGQTGNIFVDLKNLEKI